MMLCIIMFESICPGCFVSLDYLHVLDDFFASMAKAIIYSIIASVLMHRAIIIF